MGSIFDIHAKFLKTVIAASHLYPDIRTVIPTVCFLVFFFILLYQHILQPIHYYTRWKTRLFRNLKFHWIYFNGTRLWFVMISCFRRILLFADGYIEETIPEKNRHFNKSITQATCMIIVSSLALLPLFIMYLNFVYKNDMPNFLMWVMEDPWVHHEIGISGHCLERPLRINTLMKLKNCSYRSRKSNSFDTRPWTEPDPTKPLLCRGCKSMMERNVVNSVDNLTK